MPSLKALKQRIHSVQSTRKITAAMKMVATSYYRRHQESLASLRTLHANVALALNAAIPELPLQEHLPPLIKGRPLNRNHLIVAIGSSRGLCGSFNSRLLTCVLEKTRAHQKANQDVFLYCLGSRLYALTARLECFKKRGHLAVDYRHIPAFSSALSRSLQDLFFTNQIDSCSLIYAEHTSALRFEPHMLPLFPLHQPGASTASFSHTSSVFGVEPDPVELVTALMQKKIETALYMGLMESKTAEESTRMIAMENATKNADDMIRLLNIQYNRTRQAYITKELIEIISGAEAT